MAAATSIILGATALASTGISVAKSVKEGKQAKEAQRKIDNYERQDISFDNTLAMLDYPTDQYNQQMKMVQQQAANSAEMASSAGARGLSLLPGIQESLYNQEEQVMANFQNQLYELTRQQAIMQQQQDMAEFQARENREQRELAGYGALYNAGQQGKWDSIGGALMGIQSLGGMAAGWDFGSKTAPIQSTTPTLDEVGNTVMRQNMAAQVTGTDMNGYTFVPGVGYQRTSAPVNQAMNTMTTLNFNPRK